MADLILKVTTEEVRNKAQEISSQKDAMENQMEEMLSLVQSLEQSWEADSGNKYIEQYQSVTTNIRNSLEALQNHVTNLTQAAERFETLGNQQTKVVSALDTTSIFS